MIKRITNLIICILLGHFCTAQISDGSLAPNFSGVDIEGNTYNLYEILGSGRGVVIDFSATWCGPCYTMHRTHFFDKINQNYGPQGTNELVVLFLESDNSTDLADLQGTGDYTVGDFTYCTDIPILDNMAAVASDYEVDGIPRFFVINPADSTLNIFSIFDYDDKLMSHIVEVGMIDQPLLDAGMGYLCDEETTIYVCSEANTFVPQLELCNFGSSTITSLSFDIFVNGALHSTQNWSGNIPSFKSKDLVLSPIPIAGASEISVVINQTGDGNLANNMLSFNVELSNVTTKNEVTVEIKTDNQGAETYWHIEDETGSIIARGGNPWVGTTNIGIGFGANAPQTPLGTYEDNQTYTEVVSLEAANCYNFVITDYYGGGIRSNVGGYKVTDHLGNVLFSGAEFEAIVMHPFLNSTVSNVNDPFADTHILMYSNPVHDQLQLSMDVAQADIAIFDLQGRQVYQAAWTQKPLELSHLSSGLYMLRVSSGTHNWVKRFVKVLPHK
jgi:thiol-disulfide isomerase/thioredoxin